jgi:hypothetical protein
MVELVQRVEVELPIGSSSVSVNLAIACEIEKLILFQEISSKVSGERNVHYAPLHSEIQDGIITASRYVTIMLPA